MDLFSVEQVIGNAASSISSFWTVLKWAYILGFGMYVVFALVVVAQVKQMLMALSGGFDKGLKILSWGHLVIAVLAFLLALMVL